MYDFFSGQQIWLLYDLKSNFSIFFFKHWCRYATNTKPLPVPIDYFRHIFNKFYFFWCVLNWISLAFFSTHPMAIIVCTQVYKSLSVNTIWWISCECHRSQAVVLESFFVYWSLSDAVISDSTGGFSVSKFSTCSPEKGGGSSTTDLNLMSDTFFGFINGERLVDSPFHCHNITVPITYITEKCSNGITIL